MSLTEETLVRDALYDATNQLAAPVHRLAETATRRGRRLRVRRRATVAAGALLVAASVAVPVGLSLGPNPVRDSEVATDPSVALPDPPPVTGPVAWWDMPASEMLRRLADLTPRGLSYADPVLTNEGENAPGEPVAELRGWLMADVLFNGHLVGGINVVLYAPDSVSPDRWTCPGNLEAPDRCSEIPGDDGRPVGRTSVGTTGQITVREVVLRRDDGGVVYVAASNSADDKWGAGSTVTSGQVPFTLAELQDIARDSRWTMEVPR